MSIGPPLAFMDAVGSSELLLVFAAALILLGPRELPKLARAMGRIASRLRSASRDFRDQITQMESESRQDGAEPHNGKTDDDLAG